VALQSDLLDAPREPRSRATALKADRAIVAVVRLNPTGPIAGKEYLVRVQDIATMPRSLLKKPVANLSPQRDEILAALDFLFTGF
jgi:toxin CcdB